MNILKINIYSLCVCLSQVNLQALVLPSVLPFYLEGSWDWTQIIRLGGECFYLWSGLPDSLVSVCVSFALNGHLTSAELNKHINVMTLTFNIGNIPLTSG